MSLADRQQRAREVARAVGCDALLAADPGTVWWLTGIVVDIATGPSPFAPSPLTLLVGDDPPRVLASEDDAPPEPPEGCELIVYEGSSTGELRGRTLAREPLRRQLLGRRVAADVGALPSGLWPDAELVDVGPRLLAERALKDADEIDAVRAALRASDAGQRRLRELATPGITEIELHGELRAAIEREAGAPVPLLSDLVSGERTAAIGGPPTTRPIGAGELILCDLAPRVGGVWADSCATVVVGGEASPDQRRAHARVRAALERALDRARPGIAAGDLDAAVRAGLDYPHHTGHGIGGSYHEQPRVVPGAPMRLAPGMVIAIEPGHYERDWGLRLEHVLLITADGAEDLSRHALEL